LETGRLLKSTVRNAAQPGEWDGNESAVVPARAERSKSVTHARRPDCQSRNQKGAALERLITDKGLADSAALLARKEAWAEAYRHTPHGKPVVLATGSDEPERP
jgi:hypothetical protein